MFQSASDNSSPEMEARRGATKNLLKFGIQFLDDALLGISPNDLVLIGAPSGIGKTQLCCNIALANLADGRRVHYIALEAAQFEIERRLKYQIFSHAFFKMDPRVRQGWKISYDKWALGAYMDAFPEVEEWTTKFFAEGYKNLHVYYKQGDFGLPQMVELVVSNAQKTDLIIIDHVHYFDFDDENENRAIREIAKTARALALEESKPIILVSHLRKKDKQNTELCSGLDEFMGSSDLTKIATKVVTLSAGSVTSTGEYETFFRTPKNREHGSVTRYLGRHFFDPRTNSYDTEYKVGRSTLTTKDGFEDLDHNLYPEWARPKS